MSSVSAGLRVSRSHAAMLRAVVRLGFRRWYERKLIEAHAWLAACFLSMVIVAAGIELLAGRASRADFLLDAAILVAGAALGWFSWKRYAALMRLAGLLSEQAVCPGCDRFGFRCDPVQSGEGRALDVNCSRCGHRWRVGEGVDGGD
ncbi:MAG TPA: hypothetical protein VN324_10615 [Quisquiliibacterium sp.]|nr:hypothetical protein [Quisquiliibacterium sp.]